MTEFDAILIYLIVWIFILPIIMSLASIALCVTFGRPTRWDRRPRN